MSVSGRFGITSMSTDSRSAVVEIPVIVDTVERRMDAIKVEQEFQEFRTKMRKDLPVDDIIKYQLEAVQKASSLTWDIYLARMEEGKKEAEARRVYTEKFQLSSGGSDRKKEADARADEEVRRAELLSFAASAELKFLEERRKDYLNLHYSLRAMLKDVSEERKWAY